MQYENWRGVGLAALKNPGHEALAQAVAAGSSQKEALKGAGYSSSSGGNTKIFKRDEVKTRLKEIREAATWGAGPDPASQKLAELARRSAELGSAVGLLGAGKLVVEIAKRRDRLEAAKAEPATSPETPAPESAPVFIPLPQLSVEEWKAKYGR
ncbi:MAG TPA: hypothetical protein VK801_20650 [Caulobacteraceae bacterium]|nr:hypothetical protein [Caulobacteraceae bacterium]